MDRILSLRPSADWRNSLRRDAVWGVAWQTDQENLVPYDLDYWEKYQSYAGSRMERELNAVRLDVLARTPVSCVLDVGIGNGSFLLAAQNAGYDARGLDVNPHAIAWLQQRQMLGRLEQLRCRDIAICWTLWDVLEHLPEPQSLLDQIKPDDWLAVAMPVFDELEELFDSRHYRPNEHLYYVTRSGLVSWLAQYGFRCTYETAAESLAGRDSIRTFLFVKNQFPGITE